MSPDGLSSNHTSNSTSTNIRVFIHWQDQVVFAGEDVKCTITFKNVARPPQLPTASSLPSRLAPLSTSSSRHASADGRPRHPSPLSPGGAQGRGKNNAGLVPPAPSGGHRSTLSLSVPSAASRARAGSIPWSPSTSTVGTARPSHGSGNGNGHEGTQSGGGGHTRSVSIVSIGSVGTAEDAQSNASTTAKPQRPARGHARASSLQIVSRGPPLNGPRSGLFHLLLGIAGCADCVLLL